MPGALSALEALCDYGLYKSTFTLHYITITFMAQGALGATGVRRLWSGAGLQRAA